MGQKARADRAKNGRRKKKFVKRREIREIRVALRACERKARTPRTGSKPCVWHVSRFVISLFKKTPGQNYERHKGKKAQRLRFEGFARERLIEIVRSILREGDQLARKLLHERLSSCNYKMV